MDYTYISKDNKKDKSDYEIGDIVRLRGEYHHFFPEGAMRIEYKRFFDGCWHYQDDEARNLDYWIPGNQIKIAKPFYRLEGKLKHNGENVYNIETEIFQRLEATIDATELRKVFDLIIPKYGSDNYYVMTSYFVALDEGETRFNYEAGTGVEDGVYGIYELGRWQDYYSVVEDAYHVWRKCQMLLRDTKTTWYDELRPYIKYLSEDALQVFEEYSTKGPYAKRVQKQIRKRKREFEFDYNRFKQKSYRLDVYGY